MCIVLRMDVLSEVLESIRLKSLLWGISALSAPWGFRVPASLDEIPEQHRPKPPPDLPEVPEAVRRQRRFGGSFYVVTRGSCWLEVEGEQPIPLAGGDLVVFTQRRRHQLRDDLESEVKPLWEVLPFELMRNRAGIQIGGGGVPTTLISGWLRFEDRENRLLTALPPLIHVPSSDQPWLEDTLRFLTHETTNYGPGAQSVINHLVQVLFIQAVRAHVGKLDTGKGNWLRAVLDPDIGQVLGLIHARPEAPWTVSSLASSVAMSRSAFAAKFTAFVGEPPLAYLTSCRMQRAATMLSDGDAPVKRVATQVGYESEAAFSNAFKRSMTMSPGAYRKLHKQMKQAVTRMTAKP